jgi:hypothetical protein
MNNPQSGSFTNTQLKGHGKSASNKENFMSKLKNSHRHSRRQDKNTTTILNSDHCTRTHHARATRAMSGDIAGQEDAVHGGSTVILNDKKRKNSARFKPGQTSSESGIHEQSAIGIIHTHMSQDE